MLGATGLRREGGKPQVKWKTAGALQESLHPRKEKKKSINYFYPGLDLSQVLASFLSFSVTDILN